MCTAARYGEQVRAALPELRADRLIVEPVGRDTANAVGLAAALVADADPDAELAVVTADHVIRPVERFAATLETAYDALAERPGRAGDARHHPDRAGHRLRLPPARARRPRCPASPRSPRSARSPTARPPRRTWRRVSTCGTPACSSGGRRRCSTRSPTTCRRPPRGCAGSSRPRRAPSGTPSSREVFPTLPKISVDYAVMEPAAAEPGRVAGRRPRRRLARRRLLAGAGAHPRPRRRRQRRPRADRGARRLGQHRAQRRPGAPRRAGRRPRLRRRAHRRRDDGLPRRPTPSGSRSCSPPWRSSTACGTAERPEGLCPLASGT